MIEFEYDKQGRLKYNTELHFNHDKPYTTKELAYICKYYTRGHVKTLALDVGRTETTLRNTVYQLKKNGLFDYYKNLTIS